MKISFHVDTKKIQNKKQLVYKDKKYPIDFDLLKKNSGYFYRNRKLFRDIDQIMLFNDTNESQINISEETVQAFIALCSNEPCQIDLLDVIPLQYLSYKYEFAELISITDKFIEEHSDELVFPSILFKLQLQPNNEEKEDEIPNILFIKKNFLNTNKEEEIIASNLIEYTKKEEEKMLLLPIPVLYRIFSKSKKLNTDFTEIIEFLFRCLDKKGIQASVLFSYIDFKDQSIGVVNRLLNDYSNKFDFNMINSTLLKTTTQLTSEMTRLKEEFSAILCEMTKKFDEQQEELSRIKEAEKQRKVEFIKMENDHIKREKEYEKLIQKIKDDEEKRILEREKKYEEEMKFIQKIIQDQYFKKPFGIFVKTLSGKSIVIEVKPSDRIRDLKNKIENREGIPSEEQCLVYSGKRLNDELTLHDYSITNNATVHMQIHVNSELNQLYIKEENGDTFPIQFNNRELVSDIKEKIEAIKKIPVSQQYLTFEEHNLKNEKTLKNYSITNNSVLKLFIIDEKLIKIRIQKSNEEDIFLHVHKTDLVKDIKSKIEELKGYPSEKQVLLLDGEILENEKTVQDTNIQENPILKLKIPKRKF